MPYDRNTEIADVTEIASSTDIANRMEMIPLLPSHNRVARTVCIGMFLDGFDTLCLAAALTVLVHQLKIQYSQIGLLISASFGGMFCGALLFGALSERFGRRNVFVLCAGLFGVFSIFNGLTWDFWSLFVCRVIQGFGFGGAVPVGSALIVEYLPSSARGRVYGLNFSILFTLGFVVAPLAGVAALSVFGPVYGWRALFLIGGIALPYAIYAGLVLPESPRWLAGRGRINEAHAGVQRLEAEARRLGAAPLKADLESIGAPKNSQTKFMEIFSPAYLKRTLVVCVLFLTVAFVQYGFNGWLPTLFVKIGGLQPRYALTLMAIANVVNLAVTVLYGMTVDRYGRRLWIIAGFAMSLVGIIACLIGVGVYGVKTWQLLFGSSIRGPRQARFWLAGVEMGARKRFQFSKR